MLQYRLLTPIFCKSRNAYRTDRFVSMEHLLCNPARLYPYKVVSLQGCILARSILNSGDRQSDYSSAGAVSTNQGPTKATSMTRTLQGKPHISGGNAGNRHYCKDTRV